VKLISVNIGNEQEIKAGKSSGKTGIYKRPTSQPVHVARLGLTDDAVVDKKNHGGPDQAIYVYGEDDYAWWAENLNQPLAPGTFGENLTIGGLQSALYSIGDRLQMGDVIIEITAPRIPCVTLAARMKDPTFVKRYRAAERPGFYCRVVQEGTVQAGLPVSITPYPGETITVLEMFRNFYKKDESEGNLRRYLNAPIAIRARRDMEKKLNKLLAQA
jgi:MOSC domain-containing protein YiiM